MRSLAVSLLGGFQVALNGKPVEAFESDKVRALLAYLVVEREQAHRREHLVGLLWPDLPEGEARHCLSQALYALRQALGEPGRTGDLAGRLTERQPGPFLLVTAQTVQLNPRARVWLDVQAFSELVSASQRHVHVRRETCLQCAQWLREAVRVYHGDFMYTIPMHVPTLFDEWVLVQRERLRLQMLEALKNLVQFELLRGEREQALEYARRQVRLDPLGEAGNRQLIRLLALLGDRNAALIQARAFQHTVEQELGAGLEPETLALCDRLRLEAEAGAVMGNLPARLSPFIGRKNTLADLTALLLDPDVRLINLLGPGGSGKTCLAIEVGKNVSYHFKDGVYLVPLSALRSAEGFFPTIGEALGLVFNEEDDLSSQLKDALRVRQMLLILDSFETILDAGQSLANLLQAAPGIVALVTSRARLNLADEQVFPLSGMQLPETIDPDQVSQ
jgi:DNA-binding SARP family transcriptional activator